MKLRRNYSSRSALFCFMLSLTMTVFLTSFAGCTERTGLPTPDPVRKEIAGVYDTFRKSIADGDVETGSRLMVTIKPGAYFTKEELAAFRKPLLEGANPTFPDPRLTKVLRFAVNGDLAAVVFQMSDTDRNWINLKMVRFHRVDGKWRVSNDVQGASFETSRDRKEDDKKIQQETEALLSRPIGANIVARDTDETEIKKLMGSWKLEYAEVQGARTGVASNMIVKLDVKGDQWIVTSSPSSQKAPGFKATFKIDVSKAPKAIDLTIKTDDKEVTWRGIYKVDGNVLTLCSTRAEARPKDFRSDEQGTTFVYVYKLVEK